MNIVRLTGSIVAAIALCSAASAEADLEKGKAAYQVCVACHGDNGEGSKELNAPRIAGQSVWYLERQLKNFKEGIRGGEPKDIYGTQMRPMAMTLTDDAAVSNVAAYVNGLEAPAPAPTIEGDVEKGKAAYATCAACHGPDGAGMQALNSPILKGQYDWYLARQIANFKSGLRGAHEKDTFGAQMRPMAMTLADEQAINDVVAYIATLK